MSTVGPFLRFGEPALAAAVDGGAHYLDSTGEGPFIRRVFEQWDPRADDAGVGLLTAFGYDYVPGNLAGALALRDAGPEAVSSRSATSSGVQISGGTRASAALMMLEPGFAFRGGRLVPERMAAHVRHFSWGGRTTPGVSIAGSEHIALPRLQPALRQVGVYLGWYAGRRPPDAGRLGRPRPSRPHRTPPPGHRGSRHPDGPGIHRRAGRRGPVRQRQPGDGPRAGDDGSVLAEVRLEGQDPYELTAALLAWGADRAAQGRLLAHGARGPVDGFGLDALEQGAAECGLVRV